MADDIRLSENIEAEFNPLVVIVAEEPAKYEKYSQALIKNGFNCEVHGVLPDELVSRPTPGAVFFVSFNLKSMDASLLARRIEQKGNICIVFAEQQGFDTAAKLSSAKMTQTLQQPYTEKNFVMAVQTIVKKRKVQHEKDLRKQSVLDRRKGMTDAASVNDAGENRVFKSEPAAKSSRTPIIFQERVRGKKFFSIIEGGNAVQGHGRFMHERRRRGLMEIQKGLKAATFAAIESGSNDSIKRTIGARAPVSEESAHQQGARSASTTSVQESQVIAPSSNVQTSAVKPTKGAMIQEGGRENEHSIVSSRPLAKDGIAYMPGVPSRAASVAGALQERTAAVGAVIQKIADRLRGERTETQASARDTSMDPGNPSSTSSKDVKAQTPLPPPIEKPIEKQKDDDSMKPKVEPISLTQEMTTIAGPIKVPTWALIAAISIGILFILFFLYQMIFNRSH